MTDFKTIPLSEIHPDKNQPRKFFDDHSIKELTESVKLKGVLQPIMVRPNGKGYLLVCGERRYKASTAAGLKEVPAVIRNLTDEEALEIQFIENIQREDVHPMDEASTFKSMIESKIKPYTIADIAAKINKPESYVVHRLSLNNLIPELQKDFWNGKFLIGHSVLFSRLSPEDQKLCSKECREWGDKKEFKNLSSVKDFIARNIMRVLSSAPFKKEDPTLNPEMGACTTCPFRSGNNPSLFDEVRETDRCFKPACFEKKISVNLVRIVKTTLEEQPEIVFIYNDYDNNKNAEVEKLLKDFKIKPLKKYDGFETSGNPGNEKVKGLWISGTEVGKIQTVYLSKKGNALAEKTKDGKPSNAMIDEEISGIKQRTARAAELDDEKVWMRIHQEIINTNAGNGADINMELINGNTLSKVDTAAAIYSMWEKAGIESEEILKVFGFKEDKSYGGYLYGKEKFKASAKFLSATPEQFNKVCRLFIKGVLDSSVSSHTANAGQGLLKQVAEQYKKKEIAVMELEQQEKRDKREERAAARIKALQAQKKAVPEKKVTPQKKTAPAKSKGKGIKALLK